LIVVSRILTKTSEWNVGLLLHYPSPLSPAYNIMVASAKQSQSDTTLHNAKQGI